ncbi:hypothetical protein THRCLA_06877 [Thraustotheca clavata]|uniref:WRKY19-like zinc finger domain-containing protein n=1 Tax=Thraustotheca clavata TaxID=74557 RepID=A0A1V9ZIB2_9STRA|nr:hypothetical protein THRCLA_06877 [Thraustotheca clavata]
MVVWICIFPSVYKLITRAQSLLTMTSVSHSMDDDSWYPSTPTSAAQIDDDFREDEMNYLCELLLAPSPCTSVQTSPICSPVQDYKLVDCPMELLSPKEDDIKKQCSIEGCNKRVRSRGLCKAHGGGRRCSVPGCIKSSQGRGLCIRHGGGRRCDEPGCSRGAQSSGKCKNHGGGVRCRAPGCTKSSQGAGFCRSHGGGKLCKHPGCKKGSQRKGYCATHCHVYLEGTKIRFEEYAATGPEIIECTLDTKPQAARLPASSSHVQNEEYLAAFDGQKPREKQASMAKNEQLTTLPKLPQASKAPSRVLQEAMWSKAPLDPAGRAFAVSNQPLTCMSMALDCSHVVVGSCDHALYTIPLKDAKARGRTLYTKTCGHKEWITSVGHLSDGRIVSAGMDSKLCLWDNGSIVRCEDLVGHAGSISLVQTIGNEWIISSSYDKTYRLWDAAPGRRNGKNGRERHCLSGHDAPILDFSIWGSTPRLVGGDRNGSVLVFDLQQYVSEKKWKATHSGHCTSALGSQFDDNIAFTGGQDGILKKWDLRTKQNSLELVIHSNKTGKGAVSFIKEQPLNEFTILTGGADGQVQVIDLRQGCIRTSFTSHRTFIYSLHVTKDYCFSGSGDGMLLVHDLTQDKLCYGLGANQAAVRAICTTDNKLIAAGDDGGVIVYDYN